MNLDRNIVIEASAGTGKTYTLVQTILQALFEKNLPMDALVALTFTKKAAGDMKERIAEELGKIDQAESMQDAWRNWGHGLPELKTRAREALETIDRAAIGTIHSYAFSLLKRFPIAAGINPDAEVDDKDIYRDDLFEREWPQWLRVELDHHSPRRGEWLEVLERAPLADIGKLARELCDFNVPLESLSLSEENLAKELKPFHNEARTLAAAKPQGVKSTRVAAACEEILGAGVNLSSPFPAETLQALAEDPSKTKDWSSEEIERLKLLQRMARNILARGDRTLSLLTQLLKPFVTRFRARILADGYLSNNALLVLARDLVANDSKVRETLKREIRLIFVDEFQDTDPLQGELILFLSEKPRTSAKNWEDVKLEPGKLFIVGDPKQSIYLFRGADIAAYRRITELVLAQGGIRLSLNESYRSQEQIIHLVNAGFSKLIQEENPISPPYQELVPRRKRENPERQNVELRFATSAEGQTSEEALEKEAIDATAWIAEANAAARWQYKDIALIFRSGTAMPPFIEQLRARDIPFVVEAERYFYRTPEVTDVLNLLRVIDKPNDRTSLVGVLRSPFAGLTDREIVDLKQKGWNPKHSSSPAVTGGGSMMDPGPTTGRDDGLEPIFELIRHLQIKAKREPLKQILSQIYEDTFLLELAARSYHRDQTIANLLKLKRLMESFSEKGETTLSGLLTKIDRFMEDDRLEGESPLADESYDAVRLLTIHKAKGLEFPVVWLPGLHRGGGNPDRNKISVRYDWSTKRLGLSLGKTARNLGDFILEQEIQAREDAEERRILYVAMTRPKDHLILSGGICHVGRSKQPAKDSFLYQLADAWQLPLDMLVKGEKALGESFLIIHPISAPKEIAAAPAVPKKSWLDQLDVVTFAKTWEEREAVEKKALETKLVITPTSMASGKVVKSDKEQDATSLSLYHLTTPSSSPLHLGTLVHRFLETWDFACEKCNMPARLRVVANSYFASQGLLKQPFPDPKDSEKSNNPPELVHVVDEAQRLLADFIGSEAWEEIKDSEIIGREVPFFYLVNGALMRGYIDLLYRTTKGQLVIGDYKTDKEQDPTKHVAQGKVYEEAIHRALGEKATFKLIYLRERDGVVTQRRGKPTAW